MHTQLCDHKTSPRLISIPKNDVISIKITPPPPPSSLLYLAEEYKDMPIFTVTLVGSVTGLSSLSQLLFTTTTTTDVCVKSPLIFSRFGHKISCPIRRRLFCTAENSAAGVLQDSSPSVVDSVARQSRRSADWKTAKDYITSGIVYEGRVEGYNSGGLLVRFRSLVGFLPFPQLSPSHSCKEPQRTIQETAKGLTGSLISFKVIQADEENRNLIFSEKEAAWSKFSGKINAGDICEGRVGSVEDYGAFIHLRFPDGLYHLTGLVHVSEVSWDLIQDIRDILNEGDEVRVKVVNVDREKSRIGLSIRQLEEDPLLETLDKVIPQDDGSAGLDSLGMSNNIIEPLPGLDSILEELLQEDEVDEVRINRQGFEKRVVSQDLQLWLSNAPPLNNKFTLLARAGRQVQEIQLTTSLDQEGIKKALQRVLERVP